MVDTEMKALAQRWIDALGAGRFRDCQADSAPGILVWHSSNDHWLDAAEQEAHFVELESTPNPPKLLDLRAEVTATGFWFHGHIDSDYGRVHIVQVCTVVDGKVTLAEEYICPQTA